ncbi:hypothetical protein Tco_1525624 [Tanacetum coccineum]
MVTSKSVGYFLDSMVVDLIRWSDFQGKFTKGFNGKDEGFSETGGVLRGPTGDHQGDDCRGDLEKSLETLYMTKSLANHVYLKKKLYTFNMHPSKSQSEHIDEFHKLLEDVLAIVNSRKLQKMTKAKGDGGEGLYVRGRFAHRDIEHGKCSTWLKSHGRISKINFYICQSDENLKRDCPRYVPELRRNLISLGTLEKEGFTVKMQSGKIKSRSDQKNIGGLEAVRIISDWVEDQDGDTIADLVVNMSPSSAIGFKTPIDMLGLPGWLVGIWVSMRVDNTRKLSLVMVYVSVQVLQGVEFEVKPLARDKEQHSAHELLKYREDSNEAAFAVAEAEKIYAHESLTFNNIVACEVISKWKAGLKDDMDARSDVYVLSNGCKNCSDDSDVYYWEYTPGFARKSKAKYTWYGDLQGSEWKYSEGVTVQVLQREVCTDFVGGTLHTVVEGSQSGDCDVEKNGKWSCIYAVGSQEYQMVCTRLDIASEDVAAYMTLTESAKEAIWLKGLAIESGFMLKIVACIATGALSKAIPGPRFQHRSKLLRIGID